MGTRETDFCSIAPISNDLANSFSRRFIWKDNLKINITWNAKIVAIAKQAPQNVPILIRGKLVVAHPRSYARAAAISRFISIIAAGNPVSKASPIR